MLKIKDLLSWGADYLRQSGVKSYRLDAEVVLRHILNLDDVSLVLSYDLVPPPDKTSLFRKLMSERAKGKPVAYITGHKEFMGLDFVVSESVLIPRPETELMVEILLKELGSGGGKLVIDLGTGSGSIAVSLVKLGGHLVHAVDISPEAIDVAKENALRHGAAEKVVFHHGDLFEPLRSLGLHGSVDSVVSNPPYIPTAELDGLQVEIRKYEPLIALDGGVRGTDYHSRIINEAGEFLKAGGLLAIEIGCGQAEEVCGMIERSEVFSSPEVTKDYSGIERVVMARKN
jgi:release factor glutamine methyltransferase